MEGFGPLLGIVGWRRAEFVHQRLQRGFRVLLEAAEHVTLRAFLVLPARLARIGEEADRRHGVDQDEMIERRQRLHGGIAWIRHALQRQAALAAFGAGVGELGHQLGAGRRGDAPGELLRALMHRFAAEQQQHVFLLAQNARGLLHRVRIDGRRNRNRKRRADHAAVVPRRVARQDQRGDAAGRHARRLHRRCGVLADAVRRQHGAHEGRDRPRPAFGVGGERRVERAVIGRLVADHVDDAGAGAPRVVQVREAVRQTGSAVQQRRGRLAGDAVVAVRRAGDDVLLQAEHAAHAGDAVERRDEMHLAGAGIGEAGVDAALEQRVDQAFGSVHSHSPARTTSVVASAPAARRSRRRRRRRSARIR